MTSDARIGIPWKPREPWNPSMDPAEHPDFAPLRERLLETFRAPAPRDVPDDLRRVAWDVPDRGLFFAGVFLCLFVLAFIILLLLFADTAVDFQSLPWVFFNPFLLLLGMGFLKIRVKHGVRRKISLLLAAGELAECRVASMRTPWFVPAYEESSPVRVVFPHDGRVGKDIVARPMHGYFMAVNRVDSMIYALRHPDAGSAVLLIDRLVLSLLSA